MSSAVAYVRGIVPDAVNRHPEDFYPTPPAGTRALLAVERFEGPIWEPACGAGDMSRELEAAGYTTISTDLFDRGYGTPGVDFLQTPCVVDNIVTNPPFKLAQEFAEHALQCSTRKVAMLCRLAWLEGAKRRQMFESTPLARVWVFSKRLQLSRGGGNRRTKGGSLDTGSGGMIAFAWFVWEHGHTGAPTIGWIRE